MKDAPVFSASGHFVKISFIGRDNKGCPIYELYHVSSSVELPGHYYRAEELEELAEIMLRFRAMMRALDDEKPSAAACAEGATR